VSGLLRLALGTHHPPPGLLARLQAGGFDLDAPAAGGMTLLQQAALNGQLPLLAELIAAGVDLAQRDDAGRTPLELALEAGQLGSAALLADIGASLSDPASRESVAALRLTDRDGKAFTIGSQAGTVVVLACWTHWPNDPSFTSMCNKVSRLKGVKAGEIQVGSVNLGYHAQFAAQYEPGREPEVQSWSLTEASDLPRLGLVDVPSVVIVDRQGRIAWRRRRPSGELVAAVAACVAAEPEPQIDATSEAHPAGPVLLWCDFEQGYGPWRTSGTAWPQAPVGDDLRPGLYGGFAGRAFLCSSPREQGSAAVGRAVSTPFTVAHDYLHFLIGGSDRTHLQGLFLVVDGSAVRVAGGQNTGQLEAACWDLRRWRGQAARLELLDAGGDEKRSYLLLDQLTFSDSAVPPPEVLQDRFDPDTALPEWITQRQPASLADYLRRGEVQVIRTPDKTFDYEHTFDARWDTPTGWPGVLGLRRFPDGVTQEVGDYRTTLRCAGHEVVAQPARVTTIPSDQGEVLLLPEALRRERNGQVTTRCRLRTFALRLAPGRPVQASVPLDAASRDAMLAVRGYNVPSAAALEAWLRERNLLRRPAELDIAYVFRVYRYLQRYRNYGDGLPALRATANLPPQLRSHGGECAGYANIYTDLCRLAGIPAMMYGGMWTTDQRDPQGARPNHLRMMFYAEGIGWVHIDGSGTVSWGDDNLSAFAGFGGDYLITDYWDYGRRDYDVPDHGLQGLPTLHQSNDRWYCERVP
jgi:hypothetical protein